jgi:hypothetical protein
MTAKTNAEVIAEFTASFEKSKVEAKETAILHPRAVVVCFDDTTPFRYSSRGISITGGQIYAELPHPSVAKLVADLNAKGQKLERPVTVIALPVAEWSAKRVAFLDHLIASLATIVKE